MPQQTTTPEPGSPATPSAIAPAQPQDIAQAPQAPQLPQEPATAREMYEAARLRTEVVHSQLEHAKADRQEVAEQLRSGSVTGADKAGLETQLAQLDARIADLQNQHAQAEAAVAAAAGLPGSQARTSEERNEDQFEMMIVSGTFVTLAIVLPLAIGFARRLWRRHAVDLKLPPELTQRMESIERAVDATAIEVERIGEGQRFVTTLLAARNAEAMGARESSRELRG